MKLELEVRGASRKFPSKPVLSLMEPGCAGKGRWPLLLLELRATQKTPYERQASTAEIMVAEGPRSSLPEVWKISAGSAQGF